MHNYHKRWGHMSDMTNYYYSIASNTSMFVLALVKVLSSALLITCCQNTWQARSWYATWQSHSWVVSLSAYLRSSLVLDSTSLQLFHSSLRLAWNGTWVVLWASMKLWAPCHHSGRLVVLIDHYWYWWRSIHVRLWLLTEQQLFASCFSSLWLHHWLGIPPDVDFLSSSSSPLFASIIHIHNSPGA